MKKLYEYESNNSGGDWWLLDQDWKDLENAGWRVWWGGVNADYTDRKYETFEEADKDRWLDAAAKNAQKEFDSEEEAIEEFEEITGMDYNSTGCMCCGQPHYIREV